VVRVLLVALALMTAGGSLTGCGSDNGAAEDQATQEETAETEEPVEEAEPGTITRDEFGDDWPFTVEGGVLRCEGEGGVGAVIFEAEETEYGVNGVAKSQGYADIEPIWADEPSTGAKKNIGPIIDRGLELC
jgi:hypothetical protein